METAIRYGTAGDISGRWERLEVVADCGCRHRSTVADVASAARRAVSQPLEFPPIGRSVIPDDRVTVLLDADVPRGEEIAAAVVGELLQAGVKPQSITLLESDRKRTTEVGNLQTALSEHHAQQIRHVAHNPDAADQMAFLTALESGTPIRLNRSIVDADMVIPIGRVRPPGSPGYFGIYSPLFPAFSDRQTICSYLQNPAPGSSRRPRRKRFHAAKQVAWLLGVQFTVQVIPGAGGGVLQILAGQIDAVRRRAQSLYTAAWQHEVATQAALVVATVGSRRGVDGQFDLIRAIRLATPLVEPGGAILVCSEIDTLMPHSAFSGELQPEPAGNTPSCEMSPGGNRSAPATRSSLQYTLQQALERASVYLLSNLPAELVEQLGMAPVANDVEAARLLGHFPSCIVLRDAPDLLVLRRWER